MNTFICHKCASTDVEVRTDARGVARVYCKKCGTLIQIAGAKDLVPYINELQEELYTAEHPDEPKPVKDDPPCPYCTEKYVLLRGNERTRIYPIPLEIKYCPICGRKVSAKDREY